VIVGVKERGPNRIQVSVPPLETAPAAWELYETTRNVDCLKVDTVAVRNGVAEFDLPDEAIFTLVGKLSR
jgi:hypothetical protein